MTMVLLVFISAVLVNNFVLSQCLGICPFLGVSRRLETAVGMGVAVTFVMALSSAATFVVYNYVLVALGIEYMYNIAFILIIACLVQLVEMFLKKSSPALYQSLGIYLPLITTNCAVLGVVIINKEQYTTDFLLSVINSVGAALGFTLAIILFAGIREKMERNNIPQAFHGFPIALITAGLMSIAFMGFSGLIRL
jgi:electron transport complex protein RnfA